MDVSKNRGTKNPQNGWFYHGSKPYSNGMIWGYHYFWKHPYISPIIYKDSSDTQRPPLEVIQSPKRS